MSLRALGSLLIRFSQRGGGRGLASRSSSRTLRDLDIGDGAFGALAVGSFAALFLYSSSKEEDESLAPRQVTNVGEDNNMYRDPAIRAKFTDQDGKVDWVRCIDYIKLRKRHPELTDGEVLDMMATAEAKYRKLWAQLEAMEVTEEDTKQVDESAMMARFEEWIKQNGRSYRSEEEKANRYKHFKVNAMEADRANALFPSRPHFAPNNLGDWSKEEISYMYIHRDVTDWEHYFETLARRHDKMRAGNNLDLSDCTDAVKEVHKKQAAMAAERGAAAGGRTMGDNGAMPRVNSTERVSQIRTQSRGVRG